MGRTYLYVHGRRNGYYRSNGVANDGRGGSWIRTAEQYAADVERAELERRLHAAGVELRHGTSARRLSVDAARRILAIVEEETA
ncbi:hypothetical protein ABT096_29685 [Streptomyces sp. NPDC002561]|uniref:beta barrel domain-containing protein n=1 Tax=Streptomyces sp. NPDC002561 TaxID=3154418 RepID=UPI0033230950